MTTKIKRILIANRGEIACRIIRTCKRLGLETVAVYSDPDATAPHVLQADRGVRLGGTTAAESYLDHDKIIAAARRSGADAIHPGYGFLSENAAFARACEAATLVFVGPGAEVIERLGSKREARAIAEAAGVPVVPGHAGDDADEVLIAAAHRLGFPVLLKASAGGGGKGMRIVRAANELSSAIAGARREALAAFGDATLLIEKYLEQPRHIEVQILADAHGKIVHLFERECSIQRRHQKIIEEAPAPRITADLRQALGDAAIAIARAVGYRNAGTVEFIVDGTGAHYFLEVNTRLQVEHPVTELVVGVDLVELQLAIAQGQPLPFSQDDLALSGHAIECRIYAEDPANGFLPTTGTLRAWNSPPQAGLRIDTGVAAGTEIGIHYDPMLAKIVGHGATREAAIDTLATGLEALHLAGVVTNRSFLSRVLRHPRFRDGDFDTHFIEQHGAALMPAAVPPADDPELRAALVAAALFGHEQRRKSRTLLPALEPGFRNNRSLEQSVTFEVDGFIETVGYRNLGGGAFDVVVAGETLAAQVREARDGGLQLELDGISQPFEIVQADATLHLKAGARQFDVREQPRFAIAAPTKHAGAAIAPMPGKIIHLAVAVGQAVSAGDPLLILEAMKMEHTLRAAEAGQVIEILVAEGEQVGADALLLIVSAAAVSGEA